MVRDGTGGWAEQTFVASFLEEWKGQRTINPELAPVWKSHSTNYMETLVWVRTVNLAQQDRFSVCFINCQTIKSVCHGSTAKFPSLNICFT